MMAWGNKESIMKAWFIIFFSSMLLVSICPVDAKEQEPVITLMAHDSFAVSEALLKRFEERHGAKLKILKSGDAGAALTQAILSKANPLADVFFGVDNTFMSRALESDIFEPYLSPLLGRIPAQLKLDPGNRLLPVDFGDVCLNYDKKWFAEKGLPPPIGLEDLVKPAYKGLTVIPNPATSSPGLAFMFATIGRFGEDGYLNFWRQLRANDVYVTAGWSDAYYGQFSRARGGTRPIVVSYATSPPAEVFYSEKKLDEAPTAAVLSPGSAFRQIEFVGVLKGTRQAHLAHCLIDFMLAPEFQKEIPLTMWVFPVDPQVSLPEIFLKYAKQAEAPVMLAPAAIETNRDRWIESWTEVVLR
jgi:thiamine transport system substrate-binding protein